MKLRRSEDKLVSTEDIENIQFSIDPGNQSILFEVFTTSIYSNPIGSIVREIASNCVDSHNEAGVTEPIRILLGRDLDGTESISFFDTGVGLSPERIRNVYSKYFSSTKRETDTQIGAFGVGAKVPLTYTDQFLVITNYEGTRYTYTVSKDDKGPVLSCFDKEDTDEQNGTEIRIPIKKGDSQKFEYEMLTQLQYFHNIDYGGTIPDNGIVYEGKNFLYNSRTLATAGVHIALGRVTYPIDYASLGIGSIYGSSYSMGIGLKFEVGELPVTVSREAIRYTEQSKEAIINKMEAAKKEITDLYNKNGSDSDDLWECYLSTNSSKYLSIGQSRLPLPMSWNSELKQKRFIPIPKLRVERAPYFTQLFSVGVVSVSKKGSVSYKDKAYLSDSHWLFNKRDGPTYKITGGFNKWKALHIYETTGKTPRLVRKAPVDVKEEAQFKVNLGGEDVYDAYKVWLSDYIDTLPSFDDYEAPEEWVKEKRKRGKKEIASETIYARRPYTNPYSYKSEEIEYRANYIKGADLLKAKAFIVYGFQDDSELVKIIAQALLGSKYGKAKKVGSSWDNTWERGFVNCDVLLIAKSNENYLCQLPNAIYVQDFIKTNRAMKKFFTCLMTAGTVYKRFLPQTIDLSKIAKDIAEKRDRLIKYHDDNMKIAITDSDLKRELIQLAKDQKLYEDTIVREAEEIEEWFKDLPLLSYLKEEQMSNESIVDYIRLKGKKVNFEYYAHRSDKIKPDDNTEPGGEVLQQSV